MSLKNHLGRKGLAKKKAKNQRMGEHHGLEPCQQQGSRPGQRGENAPRTVNQ